MNTIIYTTENMLAEPLASKVRELLVESAGGIPIVSVSQEPIDLGTNVCVGKIGRNWLNLYKQLLIGAKTATTENVVICEHDCIYTREHLNWTPPRPDVFYYNLNVRLVEYGTKHPELFGMYSTHWEKDRKALSQLICNRELLIKTTEARLKLLDNDPEVVRQIVFAGEPGVSLIRLKQAKSLALSGQATHLQSLLKDYLETEVSDVFSNTNPNLDIRHDSNFTGPKRGKKRTFEDPYWGVFANLMK